MPLNSPQLAALVERARQKAAPEPQPERTAKLEDFPVGWKLQRESWHFHRRFFRIFRRPMRHGEYSHLPDRSGTPRPNISARTAGA